SKLAATADIGVVDQTTPRTVVEGDLKGMLEQSGTIVAEFRDVASRSQFGEYVGSNLVDEALGGLLTLTGEDGRPPTQIGGDQTWHQLSLHALPSILSAIHARRSGAVPSSHSIVLEVNAQEAAATSAIQTGNIHNYLWQGRVPRRASAPMKPDS